MAVILSVTHADVIVIEQFHEKDTGVILDPANENHQTSVAFADPFNKGDGVPGAPPQALTKDGIHYIYYGFTVTTSSGGISSVDMTPPASLIYPLIASVTEKSTITYLYERAKVRFNIVKALTSPAEEDEQFVFQVDNLGSGASPGAIGNTMLAVITVRAGQTTGAAIYVDMPQSWYTVTELNSNFRFQLLTAQLQADNPGATVSGVAVTRMITDNTAVFTFTNQRLDVPWVNGKTNVTNDMPPLTNP